MKSTFALLFFLYFGISLFAQNGISFQGIARDPQGNAIVNRTIPVKFTIGSFSETQNLTTDNFGVFSATIGKGTLESGATKFDDLVFANITENLKVEVDGNTIYDDKFNTVPYAKAAENGVPPGSIMPFAGPANKIPAGWLLCDGSSVPKTGIYQKLFEAISTLWGDDGGNFKIPDLRGMFLRGTNEGRTDLWKDPITRSVGSLQEDSLRAHFHDGNTEIRGNHNHENGDYKYLLKKNGIYTSDKTDSSPTEPNLIQAEALSESGNHSHPFTTNNTGGSETRPNNAAVVYIIKY